MTPPSRFEFDATTHTHYLGPMTPPSRPPSRFEHRIAEFSLAFLWWLLPVLLAAALGYGTWVIFYVSDPTSALDAVTAIFAGGILMLGGGSLLLGLACYVLSWLDWGMREPEKPEVKP